MTTTYFQQIKRYAEKSGFCPVCGKTTKRKKTFIHTVNPYNKNDAGDPKSPAEVRKDVDAEANAWEPDFSHATCNVA